MSDRRVKFNLLLLLFGSSYLSISATINTRNANLFQWNSFLFSYHLVIYIFDILISIPISKANLPLS